MVLWAAGGPGPSWEERQSFYWGTEPRDSPAWRLSPVPAAQLLLHRDVRQPPKEETGPLGKTFPAPATPWGQFQPQPSRAEKVCL